MWNKIVSLYIDDASIRLLEIKGQRAKKWADLSLEPGLIKGSVVLQEAEVAKRIKQLLKDHKVRTRKVFLGFSGLHSLTRPAVLPEMPATMLGEAITREARRVLPVSLDQLYLSWSYLPSPKMRVKVLIVGVPRKTADSLVKTLRLAGLEPRRMGIKPLILAKMAPLNTAILIDSQPNEFDIIIMINGVPQPIRTVPFPEKALSPDEKLEMIISDLDRTVKYYNANNSENPLNSDIPIYVSGELSDEAGLQKTLAAASGHSVMSLNTILKNAEQINMERYMVNVALAATIPVSGRELTFAAVNLNVIPAPYQPKPISLARVIGIPGGATAAALVVPVMLMIQSTAANMDALQGQLEITNQITDQRIAQKQELNKLVIDLKNKAATAKKTYDKLALALDALKTDQEKMNGNMSWALRVLPPGISLKGINESSNRLTIEGQTGSEAEVLKYARDLDSSGRYAESIVSSMSAGFSDNGPVPGARVITFTLTLISKE
jgi:hypothetical protein